MTSMLRAWSEYKRREAARRKETRKEFLLGMATTGLVDLSAISTEQLHELGLEEQDLQELRNQELRRNQPGEADMNAPNRLDFGDCLEVIRRPAPHPEHTPPLQFVLSGEKRSRREPRQQASPRPSGSPVPLSAAPTPSSS